MIKKLIIYQIITTIMTDSKNQELCKAKFSNIGHAPKKPKYACSCWHSFPKGAYDLEKIEQTQVSGTYDNLWTGVKEFETIVLAQKEVPKKLTISKLNFYNGDRTLKCSAQDKETLQAFYSCKVHFLNKGRWPSGKWEFRHDVDSWYHESDIYNGEMIHQETYIIYTSDDDSEKPQLYKLQYIKCVHKGWEYY